MLGGKFNIITAEQLPGLREAIIEGFRPTSKSSQTNKKQRRNSNVDVVADVDEDDSQVGFTVLNRTAFIAHACIDSENYDTFRSMNTKDDDHQKHVNLDSGMQNKSQVFYNAIWNVGKKKPTWIYESIF